MMGIFGKEQKIQNQKRKRKRNRFLFIAHN